jgi:RNA polymerase sigma-70 factor, ECF subfamily
MKNAQTTNEQVMQELEQLVRNQFKPLLRLACSVTRDPTEAEEVVQDALANLLELELPETFKKNPIAYLRRAVINGAKNAVRSRIRRNMREVPISSIGDVPAPEPNTHGEELSGLLDQALRKIDPELLVTLDLHYNEKLSCSRIARLQGKRVGTVYANLWFARNEVKKQIRIQEKERETQNQKHEGNRRPLPDPAF